MTSAHVILIHCVRGADGAREPVGAWALGEDSAECYYAPGKEHYEARGRKALAPPFAIPLWQWAQHKATTSPNWQVHELEPVDSLFFDRPPESDLARVLEEVRAKSVTTTHGQEVLEEPRAPKPPSSAGIWPLAVTYSWRIAAELTRRHPELMVHETHPGGGMYDVLMVAPPGPIPSSGSGGGARVEMNRAGSLHVWQGSHHHALAQWPEVILEHGVDRVVLNLEAEAGWTPPQGFPPATARTLAYRFIATALHLLSGERSLWDARNEFLDSAGDDAPRLRLIDDFPAVLDDMPSAPRLRIPGEPHSHYWVLTRDGEAAAVVSIEGRFYRRSGQSVDLLPAYVKHGRRIRRLAAALMNPWL